MTVQVDAAQWGAGCVCDPFGPSPGDILELDIYLDTQGQSGIVAFGMGITFDPTILQKLLKSESDVTLAVDRAINDTSAGEGPRKPDLVKTAGGAGGEAHRFVPGGEAAIERYFATDDPGNASKDVGG